MEAIIESNPSVLSNILKSVFGVTDQVNLTFSAGNLPVDVDGQLEGSDVSYPNNYFVTINTTVLNSATQPYIAAILLHEGLHAYFQHLTYQDATFRLKFPCLDTNSNGDLIYIQDGEHEYLTRYVDKIAESLRMAYPQLEISTAKELSWGGLQKTRAYKLNSERLDQIIPYGFSNGVIITNQIQRTGGCNNF
ncbi:MAG: hypothetical protein HC905_16025 [Bacteroidales bacterium]|nr:hypothetical protein [Bacteroidales bacterium]